MSVNVGRDRDVQDQVDRDGPTTSTSCRLGYYQGQRGAHRRAGCGRSAFLPQTQPACLDGTRLGPGRLRELGAVRVVDRPGRRAVSGVYLAHLVREDTGGGSLIPFVVRDDAAATRTCSSRPRTRPGRPTTPTAATACTVHGVLPAGNPAATRRVQGLVQPAVRPRGERPADSAVQSAEYPMIRFLEANGYDVSLHQRAWTWPRRAPLLTNHKAFLSVGHDEYWSGDQRANIEAARDQGVNLGVLQRQRDVLEDPLGAQHRRQQDAQPHPGLATRRPTSTHRSTPGPATWTGTWRDPRFSPPGDGGRPENAVTGQFFLVNSGTTDIRVPAQYGKTAAVAQHRGGDPPRGRPAPSAPASAPWATSGTRTPTTASARRAVRPVLDDVHRRRSSSTTGPTSRPVPTTHHLTLYRAASGALVFGAGTVQWSWGLDGATTRTAAGPDMQQATVNLFADQGVQPPPCIAGLTARPRRPPTRPRPPRRSPRPAAARRSPTAPR